VTPRPHPSAWRGCRRCGRSLILTAEAVCPWCQLAVDQAEALDHATYLLARNWYRLLAGLPAEVTLPKETA